MKKEAFIGVGGWGAEFYCILGHTDNWVGRFSMCFFSHLKDVLNESKLMVPAHLLT